MIFDHNFVNLIYSSDINKFFLMSLCFDDVWTNGGGHMSGPSVLLQIGGFVVPRLVCLCAAAVSPRAKQSVSIRLRLHYFIHISWDCRRHEYSVLWNKNPGKMKQNQTKRQKTRIISKRFDFTIWNFSKSNSPTHTHTHTYTHSHAKSFQSVLMKGIGRSWEKTGTKWKHYILVYII